MSAVSTSAVSLLPRQLAVTNIDLSPTPASASSQQHFAANNQRLLPPSASTDPDVSTGHGSSRSATPPVTLSTTKVNISQGEYQKPKPTPVQLSPATSDHPFEQGDQPKHLKNTLATKTPTQEVSPVSLKSPGSSDEPMEGVIPSSDAQAQNLAGAVTSEYRPSPTASTLKNILAPNPEESNASSGGPEQASLKRARSPTETSLPSEQSTEPAQTTSGYQPTSISGIPSQGRSFRQQSKGLAALLGPSFEDWKFSEEALIQALQLKSEQERTKQEFYRLENRKKLLDLLNAAARAGVPGPSIPSMLGSSVPSPPPPSAIDRTAAQAAATSVNSQNLANYAQQPVAKTMVASQINPQRISLPNASLMPTAVPYLPQTGLTQAAVSSQQANSGTLSGLNQGLKGPPTQLSGSMMAAQNPAGNINSPPIQIVKFEDQQSPTRFRPTHARSASAMPFGAARPITQAYYARPPLQGGLVAVPGPAAPAPPANNIQFHHWRPDQQIPEKAALSPRRDHREPQHDTREGYPGPAVQMRDGKGEQGATLPPAVTSGRSSRSSTSSRDFASSLPENPHAVKRRSFAGHTRYRSETVLPRFESWYGRNDNEGVSLLANMASERSKHSLDMVMDKDDRRHSASDDAGASTAGKPLAVAAQQLPPPVQGTASSAQPSPGVAQTVPPAPAKQEVLQPAINLKDER